jgi:2-desacetyl-2-hydroxyethyl bacteriochlorophyllide A dehydrogenase
MKARCLAITAPDRVEIRTTELPEPREREVLIDVRYTCTSPGTELRNMGTSPASAYPFVPGYAMVGNVLRAGKDAGLEEGTSVFVAGSQEVGPGFKRLYGGHMSHAITPVERVLAIPESVDPIAALLVKLGGIAYHGMRLSRPLAGEKVAVIGLGVLGQLSARMHALSGAHVVACDRSEARVKTAVGHGFETIVAGDSLKQTFATHFPAGADLVVDVTGVAGVVAQGVTVARALPWDDCPAPGPRYLVQGSYEVPFSIPYGEAFMREMTFLVPRDVQPRDQRMVMDLMARGVLKVRDLISDVRPPERAAETYAELRARNSSLLTVAFQWR